MTAPEVKVTQADRDASVSLIRVAQLTGVTEYLTEIEDGSYDENFFVQAFARHRATATTPLEARIAALEGAIGEAVKQIETAERVMLWAEHRMACEDYAKVIANDARNIAETAASLRAMLADDGEE